MPNSQIHSLKEVVSSLDSKVDLGVTFVENIITRTKVIENIWYLLKIK